jgi:16S rRNA processing protein RimM
MEQNRQWVVLAHILRPQGRKGEVLAELLTDFPARFTERPNVWLAPGSFAESDFTPENSTTLQPAEIVSHWLPVGRNAGRIVLKFKGTDSIAQAEALADLDVVVPLAERVPLEEGSVYISDLIGSTVYDRGVALGVVADVHFPTTPDGSRRLDEAAPLLEVSSPEHGELLVPFAKSYVVEIDPAAKAVHMELPAGLAELNHPKPAGEGT